MKKSTIYLGVLLLIVVVSSIVGGIGAQTPVLGPYFSTPISSPKYMGSSSSFACAPGVASGTGATCVCASNHTCTTSSGVLTVVTGSGTTSGLALTVTLYSSPQSPYPSCVVVSENTTAFSTVVYTAETSTGFTRQAWSAPAYPATYTVHYVCGN